MVLIIAKRSQCLVGSHNLCGCAQGGWLAHVHALWPQSTETDFYPRGGPGKGRGRGSRKRDTNSLPCYSTGLWPARTKLNPMGGGQEAQTVPSRTQSNEVGLGRFGVWEPD